MERSLIAASHLAPHSIRSFLGGRWFSFTRPPASPDLKPHEIFLWDYGRSLMYGFAGRVPNLDELTEVILQFLKAWPPETQIYVWNQSYRLDTCRAKKDISTERFSVNRHFNIFFPRHVWLVIQSTVQFYGTWMPISLFAEVLTWARLI
jgi:hypothetical protein